MNRLVECVPNFSEGRRVETVERLAGAIESVDGAVVLDTHMDADHNRSVITFVADANVVVEAAVRAVSLASVLIDLRQHAGQHPRLGATDVLPFIPVRGVTMEDCIALAHEAGRRIASELQIPVYFYERAARRSYRASLEDVRRGGFELLRDEIGSVERRMPDVGEPRIHESAGACIVGARPLLVAYNVNLQTSDLAIARRIARTVRARDGGLRFVKALGFELRTRGIVQVSMNLIDFRKTALHEAFEVVTREAARYDVQVVGSEIVGLVPQAALDRSAEHFLQIENFSSGLVLENRIETALAGKGENQTVREFIGDVAGNSPTPGGGAVAAHVAALGAALGEMVARMTIGREKHRDVEPEVTDALALLTPLRSGLVRAISDDSASFERVLRARRMPENSNEEKLERDSHIEEALKGAAIVPLEVAAIAIQVLESLETLAEIGNTNALSDAATGAQICLASIASARYNVLVNTAEIEDEEFNIEHRSRADDLLQRASEIAERIEALLLDTIG